MAKQTEKLLGVRIDPRDDVILRHLAKTQVRSKASLVKLILKDYIKAAVPKELQAQWLAEGDTREQSASNRGY